MTWAIYAPVEDMVGYITRALQTVPFTTSERNAINRYLDNGMTAWPTAPCIPPEHPCFATDGVDAGDGQCMRVIVITNGTLAGFKTLLQNAITKYPNEAQALRDFLLLLSIPWYAVDPYPPPVGYFTGMTC